MRKLVFLCTSVMLAVLVTVAPAFAQNALTNGSFESSPTELTNWTTATSPLSSGTPGTCSFNAAVAPGTEALTSTVGFAATDGSNVALGGIQGGTVNNSCVLYQDVAVPAAAKTATLTGSWGIKYNGLGTSQAGVVVGVFPTSKVPYYLDPPAGGGTFYLRSGTADTTLVPFSRDYTVTAYAGGTVRVALMTAKTSVTGSAVGGFDNVSITFTLASANLGVTLTQSTATPPPGTNVTYTLTATNAGPDTASTVSLSDPLPANMTFVSATAPAGWTASTPAVGSNGTVNFTRASWTTGGGSQVFTIVAQVASSTPLGTTITNTATVSSAAGDPVNTNDTATATATASKQAQSITFEALVDQPITASPLTVTATASSGLAVSFSSQTPSVCTVTGTSVTLLTAGTCTIRASQPGDTTYLAATDVDRSFTVSKIANTITFGPLSDQVITISPMTVSATASSGLAVSFSSQTPGTCAVAGSAVAFLTTGVCTVRASQAGDVNYVAATDVDRSFTVSPTFTSITPTGGAMAGGTTVTLTGVGFATGATVSFGGTAATGVTVVNATTITAVTPAHAAGPVSVVVTNADSTSAALASAYSFAQKYYLAEGATTWTFETSLLIANRTTRDAPVLIAFNKQDGTTVTSTQTVGAGARLTLRVAEVAGMEDAEFGTVVESLEGVPLFVERTMYWDDAHGMHTEAATDALSRTWHFAEGVQTSLDTFLLIANPGDDAADVTVTYLLESGAPVTETSRIGPRSRVTLAAGALAALRDQVFSISVESTQPVVAERSVYFGTARAWDGGTCAMGTPASSNDWYFAEGATGPMYDMFLLLTNPNATAAVATVTYLLPSGPIEKQYALAGESRRTIIVSTEDAQLAGTSLGMAVHADLPIVAEQSMYWSNTGGGWREGHASMGSPNTSTAWGLAEGVVGGDRDAQTYLLLANPGETAADVEVTYRHADGTPVVKTYNVPAASRLTVWVNGEVPELSNETFSALAFATNGQPIVVERAMYWNAGGQWWAAGSRAMATRLTLH